MWAIALKEFRQVRRDHRLVALMVVMPVVMLVVFGYAAYLASFEGADN